jgi:chloramphenicol-sensitive protein RarD
VAEGKLRYYIAAVSSTIIWGFFSIPLRSLRAYPSEQILYYRIFASLIITWLLIAIFKKQELRTDLRRFRELDNQSKTKLRVLILVAGILITGNWFTFIYAVNNVSLKSAAFAYMVCPLITAVGGFLILKEDLSRLKWVGIGIAFCSIIILANGSLHEVLWSVFIASLYAFYLIIQRAVQSIDKLVMLGIQLLISSLLMLPLFLYHFQSIPVGYHFWFTILLISLVFTIIPLFLSLYALIAIPSSTLGIIIYINPIVAFTVAFIYFQEGVTELQAVAYGMLLAAVVVFNWAVIRGLLLKRNLPDSPYIDVPIE